MQRSLKVTALALFNLLFDPEVLIIVNFFVTQIALFTGESL